jgi:hypothetical protein
MKKQWFTRKPNFQARQWTGEFDRIEYPELSILKPPSDQFKCSKCERSYSEHGVIYVDSDKTYRTICPENWIIYDHHNKVLDIFTSEVFHKLFEYDECSNSNTCTIDPPVCDRYWKTLKKQIFENQ